MAALAFRTRLSGMYAWDTVTDAGTADAAWEAVTDALREDSAEDAAAEIREAGGTLCCGGTAASEFRSSSTSLSLADGE